MEKTPLGKIEHEYGNDNKEDDESVYEVDRGGQCCSDLAAASSKACLEQSYAGGDAIIGVEIIALHCTKIPTSPKHDCSACSPVLSASSPT